MKYSVSIYSFMNVIRNGEITAFECIKKAKELGFDAIELVDFVNFKGSCEQWADDAKKIREEADKHGLEISALAISADLINGSNGDSQKEIERIKKYIDICELIGIKKMRHDITQGYLPSSGKVRSYEYLIPELAEKCREIADYAATKSVMTMTENHGFFSQDSERVEKLYNAIDHPNFALLCDIGNFTCADENPALAVARVAPYTKYVHAKDFVIKSFYEDNPGEGSFQSRSGNYLRGTIIGHGNVPVKQCLHLLKKVGYDDTISIEFEGLENSFDAIRIGLTNLKKYWSEV